MALQCELQDHYLIDLIFSNMNPQMRSSLIFARKPTTICELKALANSVQASLQADVHYYNTFPAIPQVVDNSSTQAQQTFARKPQGKCFSCGNFGHIARFCQNKGNEKGNSTRR